MIYAYAVKLNRLLKPDDDLRDECVASSQSIDGDGDIIMPQGWLLNRVTAGQCKLLDTHNKTTITSILGNVESATVQDKALRCGILWAANESPLAAFAMKMSRGGFLNGFSVGFVPKAIATLDDIRNDSGDIVVKADERLFIAACKAMGIDPAETAAKARRIIVRQELCELSALGVPSNPDAMLKALGAGAVREEDFASIGLGAGAEWELLTKGAASWHGMTGQQKKSFSDVLTSIANHFAETKGHGAASADQAQRRAAEAETDQRRAELMEACKRAAEKLASLATSNA